MQNRKFVIGAILVAIAMFAFVYTQRSKNPPPTQPSQSVQTSNDSIDTSAMFIREHSPRFGNSLARVTVVEWLDPECEACRVMHPIVKRIIDDYQDRVLFVIRYMPYHQGSMFAASALEEAKEHGKYKEALDVLFEKQPLWGDHNQPKPELIPSYLTPLGIPAENLERERVIAKHGGKIRLDQEDGTKLGVQGTPTFFVNQRQLSQLGDAPLRAAIDAALAESAN
jgi:protein-disulfide isomerase